ncbi:MAG: type II secretion system GspH family protein, partial [Candidatus Marinimicrobia bacterium]|nr:type II secretion system GspH family protein [Candidatus Neomarinimicrobiota bacterium]
MRLKKGFTLIELLVVVSIIAMLTALIMVNINAVRERARDVERKSDLDQIKKALRMYYNDNNRYPETGTDNKIKACGNPATIVFNWGAQFICSGMVYMKILPQDPIQGQTYSYQQQASGQDFRLWATLENKSDGEITKSQTRCSGSWSAGQ